MTSNIITILGFTGSLREDSFNKAALKAAQERVPEGAVLKLLDLSPLPFFNEDLEKGLLPKAVVDFKEALSEADGILIATPEYNFSIPPVLKNALDWASRGKDLPLSGKPAAIMSASPGMLGGARVQYHLRQVCLSLNLHVLNRPEVFITKAGLKFDEKGHLIDEQTGQAIQKLLEALVKRVKADLPQG